MLHLLENEFLSVAVNEVGAELTRVTDKADGYEFLWSGDASVWSGHAPLLFPFVGKIKDGRYTYGGKTYEMTKHGFARRETFRCVEKRADSLTFLLDDWQAHWENYPFRWALRVTFALQGRSLRIENEVENLDAEAPLWYSIGAHPAIACVDGELRFANRETIAARQFGPDGLIAPEEKPFLQGSDCYKLLPHTFDNDTYILTGLTSPYIDVRTAAAPHWTRVHLFDAPYVGIWAKPAAPYVCVEPWQGLDDREDCSGELTEKEGVRSLPPRGRGAFTLALDFH